MDAMWDGVAGFLGCGQQHRPHLGGVQEPGGDQLAEVEGGPVQGGVAAARLSGGHCRPLPARAARP
jgi:hypothetical protein